MKLRAIAATAALALAGSLALAGTAIAADGGGSADTNTNSRGEKTAPRTDGKFADYVYVGFGSDPVGAKANGFASNDSPYVAFYDQGGNALQVQDYGNQSFGNGIHNGDFHGGIGMTFAAPTTSVTMYFGNDDAGWVPVGGKARLTGYRNGVLVKTATVLANRNDEMDQTIVLNDTIVDYVVFDYIRSDGTITDNGPVLDAITLNPLCTQAGTNGANTLVGTSGEDVLCGGGGNDTLKGLGGEDYVYGGGGNDKVITGGSTDLGYGGPGRDTLKGGGGYDYLYGGKDRDALNGGAAGDFCNGGPQRDTGISCQVKVSIP